MRAAFVRAKGPAANIEFGELPRPTTGPTDVLVRMAATAVNHVDLFVRWGAYQTHTPFPFVIGRDLVGSVAAVGAGVGDLGVGDRVWCNSLGHAGRQGSFAEYAVVSTDRLYHLPNVVEPVNAVAVLHAATTAHIGLFRDAALARVKPSTPREPAALSDPPWFNWHTPRGRGVIATASPRDHDWCRACGADVVLDYHDPNLYATVRQAAPAGVDVWRCRCLKPRHSKSLAKPPCSTASVTTALPVFRTPPSYGDPHPQHAQKAARSVSASSKFAIRSLIALKLQHDRSTMRKLVGKAAIAIGVSMIPVGILATGMASADDYTGKSFAEAQSALAGVSMKAVIASRSGDTVPDDQCVVTSSQKAAWIKGDNFKPVTDTVLLNLNCSASVATATHAGNSAASMEGQAAIKAAAAKATKTH